MGLAAKSSTTKMKFALTLRPTKDLFSYLPADDCEIINKDVIHELKNIVENIASIERFVIILMDEMKVLEN